MANESISSEAITFNDLPKVMYAVLSKVERMERIMVNLREDIRKTKPDNADHEPLTISEACEIVNLKKPTVYHLVQSNSIPHVRRGKNITFFKDELIKWLETGRKSTAPLTMEEINSALGKRTRRKK